MTYPTIEQVGEAIQSKWRLAKLDEYAQVAMGALLANPAYLRSDGAFSFDAAAGDAYEMAVAMLEERDSRA